MTEPTHLTRDQLAPIVAAVYRREAATLTGARLILPPLPTCPTCRQQPTELATSSDSPDLFVRNRTALRFRPCGHTFTADGEDIYEAYNTARQEPESLLPDDGTSPEAPPAATPLEEAQATVEGLRYQIRRAREALATDEPDSAEAAIARVRALHKEEYGCCAECTSVHAVPYPCPTIRALNGVTPNSKENPA